MKEKPTSHLMESLSKSNDIHTYIKENQDAFIGHTLAETLNKLSVEKGLPKSVVIKSAEINEIYGYQIFAGKRKPSRDILLCLCIGLTLDVDETQQVLKSAGLAPLYPKNKRDSVILYGINRNQGVCEINEQLYSLEEPTL